MDYQADKRFGAHLRAIRKKQGMSQEVLAAKLQLEGLLLTRSAVGKLEAGQRHFYLEELLALQKVLGVSFDELLDMETC